MLGFSWFSFAFLLLLLDSSVSALDNGLGRLPLLGFNSWVRFLAVDANLVLLALIHPSTLPKTKE